MEAEMKSIRLGFLIALIFSLLAVTPLFAKDAKKTADDKWVYGIADVTFTHPFHREWVSLQPTIDKNFGCKSVMKNAEWDVNQQIIDTEALIEMNVDVLQVVPVDVKAMAPVVEKAVAKGIKVFAGANPIDVKGIVQAPLGGYYVFKRIAEVVAATINYQGNVFFITHGLLDEEGKGRTEGFMEVMKKYPKISFVEFQICEGDPAKSANITEDWLNKYDKIAAIGYTDSQIALPAIEIMRTHGRLKDIVVSAYAGSEEGLKSVEKGDTICDALINPTVWAWNTSQIAYRIYKGYDVKDVEPFDIPLILKSDVAKSLKAKGLDIDRLIWITPEEARNFGNKAADIFGKAATDAKYKKK
jgi:ribose transport system substrate-binding protein